MLKHLESLLETPHMVARSGEACLLWSKIEVWWDDVDKMTGRKSTYMCVLVSKGLLQIGQTGRRHMGETCDSEGEYVFNNSIRKTENSAYH